MTTDPQARPAAPARHERVQGSIILSNLCKVAEDPHSLEWEPFHPGVAIHWIYREAHGPSAALIRFSPGASVPLHEHRGFEHIYILSGAQSDEDGQLNAGSLMVHPPGTSHSITSKEGCVVLAIYEKSPLFPGQGATPSRESHPDEILLAVNGTLMRGLELNQNLLAAGGKFIRETFTAPVYRLWSINDRHPAMLRVRSGGRAVALEVWSLPRAGLVSILTSEPPGLSIGKVELSDGTEVLGVLGEPILCDGQSDITAFGGWRAYANRNENKPPTEILKPAL